VYLAGCSFFLYVLDYGAIYWAEQHLSAGVTSIFFATFTVFVVIWSKLLDHSERLQWQKFPGLLLGILGILTVFYDQLINTNFNNLVMLASLSVVLGAAGGALAIVIIKKHLSQTDIYTLTLYQMLIGVCYLFTIGLLVEDVDRIRCDWQVVSAVVYLAVIGSASAFLLYYKLLKKMNAVTLALIIYITPLVALLADYIAFDERISVRVEI